MTTHEKSIRRATYLVMAGLITQLGSTVYWTPLTFVLFAMISVPLVLLGVFLYAMTVLRILKDKKAL